MNYEEQYAEAKKSKAVKSLTARYVEFKTKGQQIIGRLVARNSVQSSAGTGTYFQYLFDTDKGMVKFAMGSATDADAGAQMGRGGVYSVRFLGKEELKGGRRLNKFDVEEIAPPITEVVGGASDIPF